jgi:Ca2+-binding RTX toxin-like protein
MRIALVLASLVVALAPAVTASPAGAAPCTISGTDGDDVLTGTEGPDVICAGAGNDVIHALGGDDVIYGGAGWDTIHAGDGDDLAYLGPDSGAGYGDAGDDRIIGSNNGGYGRFDGGEGNDVLVGLASGEPMRHNMGEGRWAENYFVITSGDDRVYGSSNADYIEAGFDDGIKTIWARGGDDIVFVMNGTIHGNDGDDYLVVQEQGSAFGGDGDDWVSVRTGTAGGGAGTDQVEGRTQLWGGDDDDIDTLTALADDTRCGGRSNDVYVGCERSR